MYRKIMAYDTDGLVRLLKENELFHTILDNSADLFACIELPSSRYTYISPSFASFLNIDAAAVVHDQKGPGQVQGFGIEDILAFYQSAFDGHMTDLQYDVLLTNGEGEQVPMEVLAKVLYEGDEPRNVIVSLRDVSVRDHVEAAIHKSEEQLDHVITAARDAIVLLDPQNRISLWNPAAERMFGYSRYEVQGKDLFELVVPSALYESYIERFSRFRQENVADTDGRTAELRALRKDGSEFPLELSLSFSGPVSRRQAVCMVRDITDRKAQEKALSEAIAKKRKAVQEKEKLLSTLSHDIRGAITASLDISDMLMARSDLPEDVRTLIRRTQGNLEYMMGLANGQLAQAQLDSGTFSLHKEDLSVPLFIADLAARMFMPLALKKAQTFTYTVSGDVGPLFADTQALAQILSNLVTNAFKYTPEKGSISLNVYALGDTVVFEVKDSGCGMTAEQQESIFEPFVQVSADAEQRKGGVGLGLSIVERLVKMHEGTISVTSRPLEGSTFTVSLPRRTAVRDTGSLQAITPERIARFLATKKILIIDDDVITRKAAQGNLENLGGVPGQIKGASSRDEARGFLEHEYFDIIMLDYELGDATGEDVLKDIRGSSLNAWSCVLVQTGHVFTDEDVRVKGYNGYLLKGYRSPRDLFVALEKAFCQSSSD